MRNPVFASALDVVKTTLDNLEAEIARQQTQYEAAGPAADAAEARLQRLKNNEAEFNTILPKMAQKVADANKTVADASAQADQIIKDANARAAVILGDADARAGAAIEAGKTEAKRALDKAKASAAANEKTIAERQAVLDDLNKQIDAANRKIQAIKQAAHTFATAE